MPKRIRGKWVDQESKLVVEREERSGQAGEESKRNRFEELLLFLKQERRQTERMIQIQEKKAPRNDQKQRNEFPHNYANGAMGNRNENGGRNGDQKSSNFRNQCIIHPNSRHLTRKCHTLLQKTVEERGKIIKDAKACKFCLSVSHVGQPCPFEHL